MHEMPPRNNGGAAIAFCCLLRRGYYELCHRLPAFGIRGILVARPDDASDGRRITFIG
jgi:hypothetical protein